MPNYGPLAELSLTKREKTGLLIGVLGIAGVAVGAAIFFTARKRRAARLAGLSGGQLGAVVSETREGGMILKHHRSAMPIKERVGLIQDLVWKSVQNPKVRKLGLQITKKCPPRDGECEARAIFDWVTKNIRYTGDIAPVKHGRHGPVEGVDLFQRADRTIEFGGGDCDDQVTAVAALLAVNGLTPRLDVTSPNPSKREEDWEHIYPSVLLPKHGSGPRKWVAMDTTLEKPRFGKEAPYGKKATFPA